MKYLLLFSFSIIIQVGLYAESTDTNLIVNELENIDKNFSEINYLLKNINKSNQLNIDSLMNINKRSYIQLLILQESLKNSNNKLDSSNIYIDDLQDKIQSLQNKNKWYFSINLIIMLLSVLLIIFLFIYIVFYRQKTVSKILKEANKHSDQNEEILIKMSEFKTLNEVLGSLIKKAKEKKKDKKKKK